jgi:gluconate 2-dehydrogenase gamma chain
VGISRRTLLKRIGVVSTAAVVPAPVATPGGHEHAEMQAPASVAPVREAYETLTAAESDVLEAVTARLIPADALGPGAREARAAHYIDRALAGPLSGFRANYSTGLAALDGYARAKKGSPFAQLSAADQDALLIDVQSGAAAGFPAASSIFFAMMRSHVIEGTFSDPYYGGNANFVGWDLIGYPGVRTSVSASEQQMNAKVIPNHRSAYDFAMFRKGGTDGR